MPGGLYFGRTHLNREALDQYNPASEQESHALDFYNEWYSECQQFSLTTSGSTGKPKIFRVPRELMVLSAEKTLKYFGLDHSDHALTALNTKYIAGKMMMVRAFITDMNMTVVEPSRIPDLIDSPYTFTALVPLQLEAILDEGISLEHYKCILVGGAPLSSKLRQRLSRMEINVYETYGMTETLSHIAVRRVSGPNAEEYFTCIHELDLATDERGCLRISGKITRGEWLQTNDRVELRDGNKFEWLGRADWTINSGGIKLQPEEIESKISQVFLSAGWTNDFFIYGFDHESFGQAAVLIFEDNLPGSEEEIATKLKEVLRKFEIPKAIRSVPKFQRSETSKLLRKETASLLLPFIF